MLLFPLNSQESKFGPASHLLEQKVNLQGDLTAELCFIVNWQISAWTENKGWKDNKHTNKSGLYKSGQFREPAGLMASLQF